MHLVGKSYVPYGEAPGDTHSRGISGPTTRSIDWKLQRINRPVYSLNRILAKHRRCDPMDTPECRAVLRTLQGSPLEDPALCAGLRDARRRPSSLDQVL